MSPICRADVAAFLWVTRRNSTSLYLIELQLATCILRGKYPSLLLRQTSETFKISHLHGDKDVNFLYYLNSYCCFRSSSKEAFCHEIVYSDSLADLVFFQNGMLEPWLESKGLSDADQVLAYFAVSKLGEPPIDGKTDTNPEGLTAAYGKWASAVAGRLQAGGLSCKVRAD